MQNFLGKDGFNWFYGVVEEINDPTKTGRVKVRIFGHHTDNLQELPTNTLPWSLPCFSPNNSMTVATPLLGDYVFGFFGDGRFVLALVAFSFIRFTFCSSSVILLLFRYKVSKRTKL